MAGGGGGGSLGVGGGHGGKYSQKARRRQAISTGLMLTSMLDILTTILFFLMKNYSQVQSDFSVGKDISLPCSTAVQPPVPALQLVVTQKAIMLDNVQISEIVNGEVNKRDLYRDGVAIVPLAQALKKQKERSAFQNNTDKKSFVGSIVMQADKGLQFSVLKKVIYTAGISDFVMFKLAVLKQNDDG